MLTKLFIHIHRILGLILCILCFSWFISGIVMIYHSFPRVSQEDRFTRAEILDTNGLPAIQDVLLRLPAKTPTRGLSLNNPYGDPVFSIGGGRQSVELYADTNVVAPVINYALCENRAARWCADRKITRVDTLYALDQWIPLAHYKREFPIYKFYFDGPEKYQLYVSSRTANILQFPTIVSGHGLEPFPIGCISPLSGKTRIFGHNSCTGHVISECSCVLPDSFSAYVPTGSLAGKAFFAPRTRSDGSSGTTSRVSSSVYLSSRGY